MREITLEDDLRDAWIGEGNSNRITFLRWCRKMTANNRGILQGAAKRFLEERRRETYDYYKASWSVVTVRRAELMGIPIIRKNGYYVLIDPPRPATMVGRERVHSWHPTKALAEREADLQRECQVKGWHPCPCGSKYQAVDCCGIPQIGGDA